MNLSFEAQYHLNGIVVHRGQNLAIGHYIAYVRNGNDWVELYDEVATSVTWETVKTQQAYILFLRRTTKQIQAQILIKMRKF